MDLSVGTENIWSAFLLLNPGTTIHLLTPSVTQLLFWIFYVCGYDSDAIGLQRRDQGCMHAVWNRSSVSSWNTDAENQRLWLSKYDTSAVKLFACRFCKVGLQQARKDWSSKKWQQSGKQLANFRKNWEMVPFLEENDMMRIHPMNFTVSRLSMWLKHYSDLTRPACEQDCGLIKERICSFKGLKKSSFMLLSGYRQAGAERRENQESREESIHVRGSSLKMTLTWI